MYPSATSPERNIIVQRGYGYGIAGVTGTVAAALAQNTVLWATKCAAQAIAAGTDPNAQLQCVIQRLRLAVTCIVAFTTPVTAGRRLSLHRASNAGAEISAGTLLVPVKKDSRAPASIMTPTRIGTTGGITVGGLTLETDPIAVLDLSHVGAAGARAEFLFEHAPATSGNPLCLNAGQYLACQNPVAMDAAGTWQLDILEMEWHEQRADEHGL